MLQNGALLINSADPAEHPAPTGMCPVVKQQDRKCLIETEYSKSARLFFFFSRGILKYGFIFLLAQGCLESQLTMSPVQANPCTEAHMFCVETGVIAGSGSYCLFVKGHRIHIIN